MRNGEVSCFVLFVFLVRSSSYSHFHVCYLNEPLLQIQMHIK